MIVKEEVVSKISIENTIVADSGKEKKPEGILLKEFLKFSDICCSCNRETVINLRIIKKAVEPEEPTTRYRFILTMDYIILIVEGEYQPFKHNYSLWHAYSS